MERDKEEKAKKARKEGMRKNEGKGGYRAATRVSKMLPCTKFP